MKGLGLEEGATETSSLLIQRDVIDGFLKKVESLQVSEGIRKWRRRMKLQPSIRESGSNTRRQKNRLF